ncbi:cytochrome P450 [Streptomyces sp. BE20]|uniref:cytochrome P450 n=1 Tax=unclassified Streptomyces TaxID=2593676 RepID=UPI002E774AB9|nr:MULTISPECIES: cytochrome P450 [unclassified Streptomyces]MED7949154.1 cytochrome P450 [Streptomyces sp. BE303]MEE1821790.1 cytochrome P450 [Streptomyces sp. BE20]
MTSPDDAPAGPTDAVPGDPAPRAVPLHGPAFAADPQAVYEQLRRHGPVAPVEIAPGVEALLVTDYQAALDLLRDSDTFSKDSRAWQRTVPPDSPLLPVLGYRPTALFSDGATHARYRQVITDGLALLEPHLLQRRVAEVAHRLIGTFEATGSADLIADYARRLPVHAVTTWFGVPEEHADRLVAGIVGMIESTEKAVAAYGDVVAVVTAMVAERRERPRHDLTSWFLTHPAGLDNEEVVRQITLTMIAGNEPTTNLIGNALLRLLTDARYAGSLFGGAMTAFQAIDEVLWHEPPLANLSAHYPRYDVTFHGREIAAGSLVLVSYAAANSQAAPPTGGGELGSGESAHLAWAAGPHACPARDPALLIAITAIEQLTSRLSELELATPAAGLRWRPGPFHRALVELPVRFAPVAG